MQIKNDLREKAIKKRKNISNKGEKDALIEKKLISFDEYKRAKTVLIYVSLDDEVKTDNIINQAMLDKKQIAVPFCRDNIGNMDFYIINSLSQLEKGRFNVREPKIYECEILKDFSNSVIIVPGLLFDKKGYRLGFGKGYYDRFLKNYKGKSIGLCYDEMIASEVPISEYDKKVDYIITQSNILICE